jgi:hypothetical protein
VAEKNLFRRVLLGHFNLREQTSTDELECGSEYGTARLPMQPWEVERSCHHLCCNNVFFGSLNCHFDRQTVLLSDVQDKIEKARETFEDVQHKVLPVTKTVVSPVRGGYL